MSRLMTRTSVDKSTISIINENQINKPATIGLYTNQAWNPYKDGDMIYVGASRGYLFATTSLSTPYKTDWSVTNNVDGTVGTLTLNADILTNSNYAKPVPVTFWGNHTLVTSDVQKTTYDPNDNDWKNVPVSSTTKSVAISKSIEYANSAVRMNLTLGSRGILVWYDNREDTKDTDVTTIKVTADNESSMPKNIKDKIPGYEGNDTIIHVNGSPHVNNYMHYKVGNAIKIKQDDSNYTTNGFWHFIGDKNSDDINYDIVEARIVSSDSCVYSNDYKYTPSNTTATYKYELNESLKSGENAVFSIMPTSNTSSIVILKCKITKFPNKDKDKFLWYIKESVKDNAPFIKVSDNSNFYIIGKISTSDKTIPTGSPYSTTWDKGIYCPDVITNVNVHIDDLCVDGSVVRDPDGSDDTDINKIYYNFDYEYGTMDGVWTTGNTTKH